MIQYNVDENVRSAIPVQPERSPNGAQGDSPGQHRIPRTRFDAISHAPKRTQGGASLYPGLSHYAPLGQVVRGFVK